MSIYANLLFAVSAIAPIFLVLAVGWFLRRVQLVDDAFVGTASKLVFNVALPSLIFVNLVKLDLQQVLHWAQLAYGLGATLVAFVVIWLASGPLIASDQDRGVFVQGAFRGNLGIIGIALCQRLFADTGLAMGSMLLAVMTLSYNVLSVFALSASRDGGGLPWKQILGSIVRNPLIISILLGSVVAFFRWPIPGVILTSGHYFAAMTLPLALVCVGASLSAEAIRDSSGLAMGSVVLKIAVLPLLMTTGAWALGFRGAQLGTLFAMFSAPTATVSYVMTRAMGGNARMAATIVATSTLLSPLTISLGLSLLRSAGLI